MEIEPGLIFTALFAALSTSVATIAAEHIGKDMIMPTDKRDQAEQPIESKVEPHSHSECNQA
jgi:hypothetical protein